MATLLESITVPRSSSFLTTPSSPAMASPICSPSGSRKISSFPGFRGLKIQYPNRTLASLGLRNATVIRRRGIVCGIQDTALAVLQTVWRVGKDGIEAGTNLVPDSVPRPIARISVTGVAAVISLFVLKSFVSTVSFVLAMMGLIYFVYIALNKDEGPRGGGGTTPTEEDSLEEARRIMEKYK
ncbi:hypothetical protein BVC80_521g110 [Macleaya cordata]|uniref:Uncharacterized protein n=1 Tax=Macleaya cordata TaxID=56857 RepID=A0A200R9D3_MACCD|nr:hypothetical protein BVC80_521g110 [Macleaya cordata]